MDDCIETCDKIISNTDSNSNCNSNCNSNDNIKTLKNICVKERPFSPTSPSTFEKGVYVDLDKIQNREDDWSMITIDFEN
tara:strand:+ start:261 stop:500 length:240 start_codon:yes stop_codon:yes gene_type:complete